MKDVGTIFDKCCAVSSLEVRWLLEDSPQGLGFSSVYPILPGSRIAASSSIRDFIGPVSALPTSISYRVGTIYEGWGDLAVVELWQDLAEALDSVVAMRR